VPHFSYAKKFPVSREKFFNVLSDYESFPQFMSAVHLVEVFDEKEKGKEVSFHLHFLREIEYLLEIQENKPEKISWKLLESGLLDKNEGYWQLERVSASEVLVHFEIEFELKFFIPQFVINKVLNSQIPKMMELIALQA